MKKLIAALLSFCVLFSFAACGKEKEIRREYIANLNTFNDYAFEGGLAAEKVASLTLRVWSNAIYENSDPETDKYTKNPEYDLNLDLNPPKGFPIKNERFLDFNQALANLHADSDIQKQILNVKAYQELVDESFVLLQSPPEGFEKCFETADKLYDAFKGLSDLAVAPTGSYTSYSSDYSKHDSNLVSHYEKLSLLVPEE